MKIKNFPSKYKPLESLKARDDFLDALLNRMLDAVLIVNWDGTIKFANSVAARLIGFENSSKCIGHNIFEYIHPDFISTVHQDLELIKMGRRGFSPDYRTYKCLSSTGDEKWIEGVGIEITYRGDSADLVIFRDITDRVHLEETLQKKQRELEEKLAQYSSELKEVNAKLFQEMMLRKHIEENLRSSEERYRSVVENIGIGVAVISPHMEILSLNAQMRKWFPHIDVSTKPLCYQSYNRPPRDTLCPYCPTYLTLQDGKVHESITDTPADGEIIHFRIISSPLTDEKGNVVAAIELVEDVTERKKLQDSLIESEKMYRTIFETSSSAIMIVDEDTTISMVNSTLEQKSGYSRKELEGKKSWVEFVHPEDRERLLEYHRLRRIHPEAVPGKYEFRFITREGEVRHIHVTVGMIPGTKKSVASFLDITDHVRTLEALKKKEHDLEMQSKNLEEYNKVLKVLLKQREKDKKEFEEKIISNINQFVLPYVEKLEKRGQNHEIKHLLDIIKASLRNITSSFSQRFSSELLSLTPKEIQIAYLIKEGKTSKEIAEVMNTSTGTIDFHRNNIRNKLGLKKSKVNLRAYLLTLT